MWIFEWKITEARRRGGRVWNYYVGMVFCAGVCAALNDLHGDLGPIPGRVKLSVLTGVAYALIAVSGIIIHQLATVSSHAEDGAEKPATAEVAPHGDDADPASVTLEDRHLELGSGSAASFCR